MIFQYKELCLRLRAYLSSARKELSIFATIAPTVDDYFIDILGQYIHSTPDNLADNQNLSLRLLILATFSAHLNLVREYDLQTKRLTQSFSSTAIQKVLPDHRNSLRKIREASNWIMSNIQNADSDPNFTSVFITNSSAYLDNLSSKTQELKTIYELILDAQDELRQTDEEIKLRNQEAAKEKNAKIFYAILMFVATLAGGVLLDRLWPKNDDKKDRVEQQLPRPKQQLEQSKEVKHLQKNE